MSSGVLVNGVIDDKGYLRLHAVSYSHQIKEVCQWAIAAVCTVQAVSFQSPASLISLPGHRPVLPRSLHQSTRVR